ncbi:angiopoietin-4-like [Heterocephalus glaber]|uniref:Angiopoietin-4-like n=1 Tax=Heterocephalus glaber TaxID=10181 RepID=A0AAX6SRH6_HETGA|nr:angiopoietin-4-like [Heterocephalus glaber]
MLSGPAMLLGSLLLLVGTMTAAQQMGQQAGSHKLQFHFKHDECSYTFFLPEPQPCSPESTTVGGSCIPQKNQPSMMHMRLLFHHQMEKLENALRNSTQRLQKLAENIQTLFGSKLQQAQQNIVQNHTAPMLELDTSLLNQTTNQTLKLTDMEAQVLNQMSHMERQMLNTSLTTDKLEKQLQKQRGTLDLLHGHNSNLETQLDNMEAHQKAQLEGLRSEKENLWQQLDQHSSRLARIRQGLEALRSNSSLLQQQHHQLLKSLQLLKRMVEQSPGTAVQRFLDCEDIRKFGLNKDGVYIILVPSLNQTKRVFCVMDAEGAWTVIQRRKDGTVNFQRNWEDYKQGFGDPSGEHWLGNEVVHQLTNSTKYSLRVEMEDWDGNTFSANFEHFQLGSEEQFYRIFLDKHSGMASPRGHLIIGNNTFSTRDADHDNCVCNCAAMMSGGWWFDACGISNLNGVYHPAGQHKLKINGIRWDSSSPGSTSSLRTSRMMMRPLNS